MHAVHLKGRTLKPINPSPSGRGLGEGRSLVVNFDPHPPRHSLHSWRVGLSRGRGG